MIARHRTWGTIPSLKTLLKKKALSWLILPCALCVLAAGAVALVHEASQLAALQQLACQNLECYAKRYLAAARQQMSQLAQECCERDDEARREIIRSFLLLEPGFESMYLVDQEGMVRLALPHGVVDVSFNPDLLEPGAVYSSPGSGRMVHTVVHPLDNGLRLVGIHNLASLDEHVRTLFNGNHSGSILFLHKNGTALSTPQDDSFFSTREMGTLSILPTALEKGFQTDVFLLDRNLYLGTAVRIDPLPWTVLVSHPLLDTLASTAMVTAIICCLLTFFFLRIISVFQGLCDRDVTTPLQDLAEAFRIAAVSDQVQRRGSFSAGNDKPFSELSALEQAFNTTLDNLKKRSQALSESEEKYRILYTESVEGLFLMALDGTILDANPTMADILGFRTPKELVKRVGRITPRLFARAGDFTRARRELASAGALLSHEAQIRRPDGRMVWLSINGHVANPGTPEAVFEALVQDVTRRKQSLLEARRLRLLLGNILDSLPSAIIAVDDDMAISLWNKQAHILTGHNSLEALNASLGDMFPGLIPVLDDIRQAIRIQQDIHSLHVDISNERKVQHLAISVHPYMHEQGNGAVLRVDDITNRLAVQEMMVQTEKMLSVGNLVAGMAHEINNPLAAIAGNSQILQSRLSGSVGKDHSLARDAGTSLEHIQEYMRQSGVFDCLSAISQSSKRASKIVFKMLGFSRTDTNTFVPCDLCDLVDETLSLAAEDTDFGREAPFSSIEVIRNYPPKHPRPLCDSGMIQQVLFNIVKNAVQAMQTMEVKEETGNIRRLTLSVFEGFHPKAGPDGEAMATEEPMACIAIQDTGPGMPPETLNRIFDPFFTTKTAGEGTGLGLSVSAFIIRDQHRGVLDVTSTPGKGTTFTIRLPMVIHSTREPGPQIRYPHHSISRTG